MDPFFTPPSPGANDRNRQQGHGQNTGAGGLGHRLHRPAPELDGGADLGRLVRQFKRKWKRMWTALKWQFHEKTLHLFERRGFRRLAMASASVLFLYNTEMEFVGRLVRPFVDAVRPGGERIYDDYPPSQFSFGGGARASEAGPGEITGKARPTAKKATWSGLLGSDGGNPAAPVGAGQLREQEARDYIEKYHRIAQAEMEKFGIPASIGLAQGLVESRAGLSKLARNNNNHFGMKCFSKKCPKGHCSNMTDDHHKDFFRKYQSAWESWRAHSQLLAGGHYSRLKKYGRDYRQWAYGLKALGYATDRTYAEKLIGMIERYELYRFDK